MLRSGQTQCIAAALRLRDAHPEIGGPTVQRFDCIDMAVAPVPAVRHEPFSLRNLTNAASPAAVLPLRPTQGNSKSLGLVVH